MIKIHCEALKNILEKVFCDWNFFYILLVPGLFGLIFPFYQLVFLPLLWGEQGSWEKTLYWILGYWVFAFLAWLIFLFVVFCQSPSSQGSSNEKRIKNSSNKNGGRRHLSASTEDLWSEDKYYPDIHSPDFLVSINAIQPDRVISEPKMTMDETWDYNYDSKSDPSSTNSINFSCKPSQKNNARTSLLGQGPGNYTFDVRKAYQSLGYTFCQGPCNSDSSSSSNRASGSSNNGSLKHQRLNRKASMALESSEGVPMRRRSASTSPYGKRIERKHLSAPVGPRSPSLPKRGAPSPLSHGINPRHLRPLRDLSRPLARSSERKKSPLVGNENCSPTPTVVRKQSRKGLHPNLSNETFPHEKGMEDKRPMIECYLKERVP